MSEKKNNEQTLRATAQQQAYNYLARPGIMATLGVFFHLLINGYYFPFADNYLQLALSKKHQKPELYPNDPGMSQAAYQSFFWNAMGKIVFWEKAWIVFFVIFLVCLWLSYYLLWHVGKQVTQEAIGGGLLVLLFITPKFGVADIQVLDSWLSLRDISFPLILFGFYLYLRGKKAWSYFLLGLSFNIHPISSYNFVFLLLVADIHDFIRKQNQLKDLAQRIGLYVLGSLPLVSSYLLRLLTSRSEGPGLFSAPETWLRIMHYRSYFHVFPFEYFPVYYALSIGYLGIYYVYSWHDKHISTSKGKGTEAGFKNLYMDALIGMGILFSVNLVFSEFLPSVFIIQFQFGRVSRFLPFFAMILLASLVTERLDASTTREKDWTIYDTLILTMYLSYVILDNPVLPLLLVALILFRKKHETQWKVMLALKALQKKKKNLILGAQVIWLFLLVTLPIVFHAMFSFPILQGVHPRPVSTDTWVDIQIWAHDNTDEASLFITPPHLSGFRVYSERAIIGEWKDGTLAFFNTSYAGVWWERMVDLGYTEQNMRSYEFSDYTKVNFTAVALKYHANYLIYRVTDYSDFSIGLTYSVAYTNSEYMVLLLAI